MFVGFMEDDYNQEVSVRSLVSNVNSYYFGDWTYLFIFFYNLCMCLKGEVSSPLRILRMIISVKLSNSPKYQRNNKKNYLECCKIIKNKIIGEKNKSWLSINLVVTIATRNVLCWGCMQQPQLMGAKVNPHFRKSLRWSCIWQSQAIRANSNPCIRKIEPSYIRKSLCWGCTLHCNFLKKINLTFTLGSCAKRHRRWWCLLEMHISLCHIRRATVAVSYWKTPKNSAHHWHFLVLKNDLLNA